MMFSKSYKTPLSLFIILTIAIFSCSDSSTGPGEGNENGGENGNFNSQAGPGSSAAALLTADTYTDLTLEIDYMPDHEPTQEALNDLKTFLQQRLNKSNITFRTPTEVPSGGESEYSADEIRELETEHRDNFTEDDSDTLETYFLFVDGQFQAQANVLGVAYYNTSMAFFGPTIDETSSGVAAPSKEKIEGTVFRHEFGHLMGLVGNGSETQSSHKTDGSAHCTEDGCLMEPAIETSDFFANIFDGDIPALDELCVEDLQANGGK
jgi:hypothetical protein